MLEVKTVHGVLLKRVIKSITELVTYIDVNFECSSTGISLQAMDPIHEAMVSLLLKPNAFQHYNCNRNMSLGLNLGSLSNMLKCAPDDHILTLMADESRDCVTFMFESIDQDKITNFEMKLVDVDDEPLEIREPEYDAIVRMPSSEFARICKDLSTVGDIVVISVTKEGLEFSTKGDTGTANIVCRQNTYVDKRESTIIDMERPVSLTFALSFLISFIKATPLASQVTLSLASAWPMMVEYNITEMGHLRFYLAPKTKEDKKINGTMELRSVQGSLLRKVVESIRDLVDDDDDAEFKCSSTGISLQATDPVHEAMVSLLLRSDGFEHYRCNRDMSLGMNLAIMANMLKCAGDDDIVTIKAGQGNDFVNFMFESLDQDKVTNFEMKLVEVDYEPLQIPEIEYDAVVRMPSSEFARICKDFSTVGDIVLISVTKQGLEFSVKGDTSTANIVCRQNTFVDKTEEATIIQMVRPVSAKYGLSYLNSFAKATPLASQVTLSWCSELPLVVEYKIAGMGHLRFYLAPKLKEYENMNSHKTETVEPNKQPKRKLKTEPIFGGETKRRKINDIEVSCFNKENMEDKKRHQVKVEKIKEEKLRLKKEEHECKMLILKEEVRMMQQTQMDKDMQLFLTPHDNLTGAALKAVLARKHEMAQRWGWE